MVGRFAPLIGITALLYGGLLFHLYDLQVVSGVQYLAKAEAQHAAREFTLARRGLIFFTDKDGGTIPAALNKDIPEIYAVPKVLEDPLEVANLLSPLVDIPADTLVQKFSNLNSSYALIKKQASPELIERVEELGVRGVYSQPSPIRTYQFGDLAAHVLGFVGPNPDDFGESGKYGIEYFYDDELSGARGELKDGRIVPPVAGQDIALTIDISIQKEGERIVRDLVERFGAKGGSVIVQDPKTGAILAMGSTPTFDPNRYSESSIDRFLNPAIEKMYEPGSVFKVLTMASGLDAGAITPETTFYDSGELRVSGYTIKNWDLKAHGTVTMTNVIEKSLNTGAAFAQRQLGNSAFRAYLEKFGFGEKTGLALPGELRGDIRSLGEKSAAINFATASFGQGVGVTPLQMVNAFSAIANDGKLMKPRILASEPAEVIREVISADAAAKVTGMMISAVDKAEVAKIPGFSVAGKTGTAQVPKLGGGGYSDRVVNTYIGFAPATDPKFVILIKLDEPVGAPLAGQTVVPAFRELAQFMLGYYRVAPDRIAE